MSQFSSLSISSWASSKPTATPISIAHARLLGEQHPHRAQALLDVRLAGRLEHLLLMRGAEPVRLVERLVEDALQRRRVRLDDALGLVQPVRVGERLHGGFDLGIGVCAAGGH